MKKKQTKNRYSKLEKIFTVAGLGLIIIGCIANIYSAVTNVRFMNDPIFLAYYYRFVVLLAGGFAIGYFLTKKSVGSKCFAGVVYAILATAVYLLFDVMRVISQNIWDSPSYPWGKILFFGLPIFAILATVLIAYFSQYKSKRSEVSMLAKILLIAAFVVSQAHLLISSFYYLSTGAAMFDPNMSFWLIIGSYLTIPIVVAWLAYLLLGTIKKRFDRLFFAVLIGAIYSILSLVLWEFRTDASNEATNAFGSIVAPLTLIVAGVLIWKARSAVK
ncbi:MAG: hypothetical protein JWM07_692 [Candidatus Saccharibacteria bacterium]|nr:hypothetical protein [Candidatus Saccharibacteria bacterium]